MRKTTSSPRFAKYAPVGGITNAAEKIFDGSWTLARMARRLSITRECVRQDVAALVGVAEYKKRVAARKAKVRRSREPRVLSTAPALQYLSNTPAHRFGPAPRFLKHVIERSRAGGQRLSLRVCRGKRPILLTPRGQPISVRVASPDGTSPEHAIGLHRINISRLRRQKHPVAVFLITTPASTCFYVLRTKDITSVDSIVLRYRELHRRSEYSAALDNWGALAGL